MTTKPHDIPTHDPRTGMILVAVLWTIALLSALAMAASLTFRGYASIIAIDRDRARADGLLEAGLELSGGIVAKLGDRALLARQTSVPLDTGTVQIRLTDEGGKINVNKAPEKMLSALFRAAGAGEGASGLAKAVIAWRKQDGMIEPTQNPSLPPQPAVAGQPIPTISNEPTSDTKDDSFRSFTDLRQLAQLPGMTRSTLAAIMPLATVFGDDKINAVIASPEVLAALPDLTPGQLAAFLAARAKPAFGGDWLQTLLGAAKDDVKMQSKPIASVELTATLDDGYTVAAKAVIVAVPQDTQPYRVLSWTPARGSEQHLPLANDQL